MTKREMMIKAHEMAKKMVGDYSARLSLALRTLWATIKKGAIDTVKAIKNLTGSEKQIAWAEDIRSRYTETLESLKGALSILEDLSQVEIVDHDPVLGDEIIRRYTKSITNKQVVEISNATHWAPKKDETYIYGGNDAWVVGRSVEMAKAGEAHSDRKAQAESLTLTIEALEKALETETEARYWIDRR